MDPHRSACQRQHHVLGHFLAIQAWLRRLDCIVLVRQDLEVFLGLQRFKSQRVKWLRSDFSPWFKYKESYFLSNSPSSLHSLFLSRVPIKTSLPTGSMTTDERISGMPDGAPPTARFAVPNKDQRRLTEEDIVQYLALLDSGLSLPNPLSCLPKSENAL